MLEVKGELVFKTVAYHRAADVIERSPVDLVAAYRAGTPPRIPGVGQAISDKIDELAKTGRMAYYDQIAAEIPPGLVAVSASPALGPKTVRQLHAELGIGSIDELRGGGPGRATADDHAACPAKTESPDPRRHRPHRDQLTRLLLDQAADSSTGHAALLETTPGVIALDAGRFLPPSPRVDRRPGHPCRDRRCPGDASTASSASPPPSTSLIGAPTRRRSGYAAGRRWT